MIREKRGLSDVVTVTLIILLAIAAVVIVWAFVRSTLEETGKQITGACVTTNVKLIGTCAASTGAVTVRNDGRQDAIDGIKLVYYETNADDSQSQTRDCIGVTPTTSLAPLAQISCTPEAPVGGVAVPDFNGAAAGGAPVRVSAAPVIGDIVCPISPETVNCIP